MPLLITALAAGLGYALAIYPMWRWISYSKQFENLGHLLAPEYALKVYFEDDHLDTKALGGVAWSIPTVMTPFVGYAPAADLNGIFDHAPQDPSVFLDSFHFGDRGNLAVAQAMVDSITKRLP